MGPVSFDKRMPPSHPLKCLPYAAYNTIVTIVSRRRARPFYIINIIIIILLFVRVLAFCRVNNNYYRLPCSQK